MTTTTTLNRTILNRATSPDPDPTPGYLYGTTLSLSRGLGIGVVRSEHTLTALLASVFPNR